MPRTESTTEEIPDPQLVYLRRGGVNGPAELVIVSEGRQIICTVSDERLLQVSAEALHVLATRVRG